MVWFYVLHGGRWGKSIPKSPFLHWKIQEHLWAGKGVCKIVLLDLITRKSSETAFLKTSSPWPTNTLIIHLTDSCVWIQHANFDTLPSSHYVQSIIKIATVPWASKEYFQDQMTQMWLIEMTLQKHKTKLCTEWEVASKLCRPGKTFNLQTPISYLEFTA